MSIYFKKFKRSRGNEPQYSILREFQDKRIPAWWSGDDPEMAELRAKPSTVEELEFTLSKGLTKIEHTRQYRVHLPIGFEEFEVEATTAKEAKWFAKIHLEDAPRCEWTGEHAHEIIDLSKPYNPPTKPATGLYLEIATGLGIPPVVNVDTGGLRIPRERVIDIVQAGNELMCREYGDDDNWCGITVDDIEDWITDGIDDDYQNFEIWRSDAV